MSKTTKVTVGGKEYPMRLSMGAMLRFKRETGKEITSAESIEDMIVMIHCAIKSACNHEKVKFDMSVEDLADCLSQDDFAQLVSELLPNKGAETETPQADSKKKP